MKTKKKKMNVSGRSYKTTESQDHSYLNEFGSPVVPLWFSEKIEKQRDELAKNIHELECKMGGMQSYIEEQWGYGNYLKWYTEQ